MNNLKPLNIGDRVRVKSTGQEVTVDQISPHGFAVIKFNSGGKHRFLNHKLEKIPFTESVRYN
ncbi:MAG: hypothetical protein OEY43_01915 [Gammaproteobacteria bacterium]|nr:hypothetical protein [Gammaproteobacteria bacterium]